jgi:serine protease
VPNDPQYGTLQWNFAQLDMPKAWDINPGATSSVIVAVVDTGVTTAASTQTYPLYTGSRIEDVAMPFDVNPDLPASRLALARDFVFSLPSGSPVLDMDGHATHVSATIAEETNNSLRLSGIAYHVRIMPVKVCLGYWELMIINARAGKNGFLVKDDDGFCTSSAIAQGVRYAADNGAKVINISLGGSDPTTTERDAVSYAVTQGAFVAMAAGNDYEDGNPTEYPAFYAAAIEGAMSVGATGKSQTRSYFSSTGTWLEIVAPGGNDRDPGTGTDDGYIWQAAMLYTDQDPSVIRPRFDRYASIGYEGTSMATPHVSGLAALLVAQGVTSPRAIEAIIKGSAKDLGAAGKDEQFGYGLIQPRAALFGRGVRR